MIMFCHISVFLLVVPKTGSPKKAGQPGVILKLFRNQYVFHSFPVNGNGSSVYLDDTAIPLRGANQLNFISRIKSKRSQSGAMLTISVDGTYPGSTAFKLFAQRSNMTFAPRRAVFLLPSCPFFSTTSQQFIYHIILC